MNKNVENYIFYGQKRINGKEIAFDFLHALCVGAVIYLFSTEKSQAFLLFCDALLISIVVLGIIGVKNKQVIMQHIYRGTSGTGIAILYFCLSYTFIAMAGATGTAVIITYVIVFFIICMTFVIGIVMMIKKDAYSKPQHSQTALSPYTGAVFAIFLAPTIFRGLQQNAVSGLLAICALFLGICMLLSINEWIKFAIITREGENFLDDK